MNDQHVFPQDVIDSSTATGVRREGGLTKRELFAVMLFASNVDHFKRVEVATIASVKAADILIAELEKKP